MRSHDNNLGLASVGLLLVAMLPSCSGGSGSTAPADDVLGPVPSLAKGGKAETTQIAFTGGFETPSPQTVTLGINAETGNFSLDGPLSLTVQLSASVAAGPEECVAGEGATDQMKAELLEHVRSTTLSPSKSFRMYEGGYRRISWSEQDWPNVWLIIRHVEPGDPGDPLVVTQVGNEYTYTGGTLIVHRDNGEAGRRKVTLSIWCANRDAMTLTYPVTP